MADQLITLKYLISTLKDVGDGVGTAKTFLEKIADIESEAERSFMHRHVGY